MIKTIGFVVRQDDMEHDEFVDYFRDTHVEFGKRFPGVEKYTTSVPSNPPGYLKRRPTGSGNASRAEGGLVEYDLVSELYFEDAAAFSRAFDSQPSKEAFEDEKNFIKEVYFVVVEVTEHLNRLEET